MYESDLLLFIAFVLLFVYLRGVFREIRKYYGLFKNIQGPKTLPLSLIAFLFTARSESDRFKILQNLSKKYPKFYSLWFGPKYFFITNDPSVAQKLLTTPECVEKNVFMEFFGFPNGLIALKSEKWKQERKLLNSSFSLPILNSYIPVFERCVIQSVEQLRKKCGGGKFDIKNDISLVVMRAVLNTTFGRDLPQASVENILHNTEKLLDIVWNRSMNILYYYDWFYSMSNMKREEDESRNSIFKLVTETWDEISQENSSSSENQEIHSFVGQLLKISNNGRSYARNEINDHVGTMLVAAGDTTSTALNFLILMIAMHEKVQQNLLEEINEVFGDDGDLSMDSEKLSKLNYVEMVIKETLRLFSPATGIFREVKADVDLGDVGMGIKNLRLPQGTNLIINIFGMHRKEEIWGPNANNFDPENFHPDKISSRHNYCFLPFANGTRLCIGNRYAMIFMKMIVVHFVKNFHFSSPLKYDEVEVKAGVTLKLIGDFMVEISERETSKIKST